MSHTTSCLNHHFQKLRKEIFQAKSRYLSLTHIPGEAQVDFGNVSFYEKGILYNGYALVLVFPHSNAAFCQLYKSKNAECMLQGLKDIFNYVGGVNGLDPCIFIFFGKNTPLIFIIIGLVLEGLGCAFFISPNQNAVITSVEKQSYGVASGILATMRFIGQMISKGIATLSMTTYVGNVQITP